MIPMLLEVQPEALPPPAVGREARAFINSLRFAAMACRAKPRTALFEACALVKVGTEASDQAHAEALMRGLREALGKPAQLYAPGTEALTFDERWLIQLGLSCNRDDDDSLRFFAWVARWGGASEACPVSCRPNRRFLRSDLVAMSAMPRLGLRRWVLPLSSCICASTSAPNGCTFPAATAVPPAFRQRPHDACPF